VREVIPSFTKTLAEAGGDSSTTGYLADSTGAADSYRCCSSPDKEAEMTKATRCGSGRRELAHRLANDLEVTLLWGPGKKEIVVEVLDHASETAFEVTVAPERALDAFHHPFAYASRQGVEYEALLPQAA
jgi:hypothetical protein